MNTITYKKDLCDLWCEAIESLGGSARKCEILNWIYDQIQAGLVSMPHEIRGSWPVDIGHQKDNLKPLGAIKSTKVGKYTYWSLALSLN